MRDSDLPAAPRRLPNPDSDRARLGVRFPSHDAPVGSRAVGASAAAPSGPSAPRRDGQPSRGDRPGALLAGMESPTESHDRVAGSSDATRSLGLPFGIRLRAAARGELAGFDNPIICNLRAACCHNHPPPPVTHHSKNPHPIPPHPTPPLLFPGWPFNATAVEPALQRMDLQAARYWVGPCDLATPRGLRPASHPPISLAHNNLHPPSPLVDRGTHLQPCRAASIPSAAID